MSISRRGLLSFVAAGSLVFLSACSEDPEPPAPTPDQYDKEFDRVQDEVSEKEPFLTFGDENAPDEILVALDLTSEDSKKFFNEHKDMMKEYKDAKLGIILRVNRTEITDPIKLMSADSVSSMAVLVYMNDASKFWDYADEVFNRKEPFENIDEVVEVGVKHGVKDDENLDPSMSATKLLARRMSSEAEMRSEDGKFPYLVVNRLLWEGDANNPEAVAEVFNSFADRNTQDEDAE